MEFIYSILSNLIQQCPKGRLLDICLSHFLKVIQGPENENKTDKDKNENENDNKNIHYVNNDNYKKDEKYINNKMESTQRKIAALDAISDLFLSENENDCAEDTLLTSTSTSSTHVHTASCNHGHHNDAPAAVR